MNGKAIRVLGDDIAVGVHQAARQVALFFPELGIGGAHGHDLHIARDCDQRAVDHS